MNKPMGKTVKRSGWLLVHPCGHHSSQWFKTKKYAIEIRDAANEPLSVKAVRCEITFVMPPKTSKKGK